MPSIEMKNNKSNFTIIGIKNVFSIMQHFTNLTVRRSDQVVSHLRYCITSWNHGNKTLVQNLENLCFKVQKQILSTNNKNSHLLSIRGLYQLEIAKFMFKFHQQLLPIIFKDFFRPNCSVHSFPDKYHLPYFSKSVSQQSIEFKGAKIWNALPVEIRHLRSNSLFVSKLKKYLAQQTE